MRRIVLAWLAMLSLGGPALAAQSRGFRGRVAVLRALHEELKAHHGPMASHTTRVAQHAYRIALRLGLSKTKANAIAAAGFMHDLGKLDMSTRVLDGLKNPDQAALDEIAKHPVAGRDRFVARFPRTGLGQLIASGILLHHERPDGKGYPQQLAGDQIPLVARIIAVADAYDAMVSTRHYNTPRSHAAAIAELRKSAGWRLDAQVVDAFIASYQPAVP